MADGIALEGIKNVKNYLIPAFKQPDNLTARSKMLVTSSMGSTAFQKGLGAIHPYHIQLMQLMMFIMVYQMQSSCHMF